MTKHEKLKEMLDTLQAKGIQVKNIKATTGLSTSQIKNAKYGLLKDIDEIYDKVAEKYKEVLASEIPVLPISNAEIKDDLMRIENKIDLILKKFKD